MIKQHHNLASGIIGFHNIVQQQKASLVGPSWEKRLSDPVWILEMKIAMLK
jgi:hypothetical protein